MIFMATIFNFAFVFCLNAATITVTNNNHDGSGSLRDAINNANSGDEIVFDANYTIVLGSELTIDEINNSTFSSNRAMGFDISISENIEGDGGGIYNDGTIGTIDNTSLTQS